MHDTYPLSETPPIPASRVQSVFAPQSLDRFDRTTRRQPRPDMGAWLAARARFRGRLRHHGIPSSANSIYVLSVGSFSALEIALMVLFSINIFWLSLSFMTALAGFGVMALGARKLARRSEGVRSAEPRFAGKTAIIVCTYNEAPARIFGMAVATMRSIAKLGQQGSFDLFILSDTTEPDIWVQEEAAFQAVREREACGSRMFYRRRSANTGKKAGNVARLVPPLGRELRLHARARRRQPDDGRVRHEARGHHREKPGFRPRADGADLDRPQYTVRPPPAIRGTALRADARDRARLLARGVSNFWGHNAIIRTRAFIESAGLPMLPGKPPFGGQILSHDFVEAALLNRAGWRVVMVPDLAGSYEEIPPSLIDFAMRDRRWAQGNLQHSRVLFAHGLHWVSRVHMAMGIMAYVSALVWFLFLSSRSRSRFNRSTRCRNISRTISRFSRNGRCRTASDPASC